jgi:hypothetical protein
MVPLTPAEQALLDSADIAAAKSTAELHARSTAERGRLLSLAFVRPGDRAAFEAFLDHLAKEVELWGAWLRREEKAAEQWPRSRAIAAIRAVAADLAAAAEQVPALIRSWQALAAPPPSPLPFAPTTPPAAMPTIPPVTDAAHQQWLREQMQAEAAAQRQFLIQMRDLQTNTSRAIQEARSASWAAQHKAIRGLL